MLIKARLESSHHIPGADLSLPAYTMLNTLHNVRYTLYLHSNSR